MSEPQDFSGAKPGSEYTQDSITYYAAKDSTGTCTKCALHEPVGCTNAPRGCTAHDTIWLTKQDYIIHRLKS